eukprot:CAMPEP_0197632234 /NCGR_PEP_ID=MMETSP1338-20131121/9080_1 /TAXON_ID=43686 ORGANISM="Pelagodinium beii, Strain RCC1491" /NCGR_SAMPLE_ID=MMETSP1338 /ASSEMBLY_ACC=CAM_ASM_000754 /LENGTH=725 /DNA_ID=CAMNT_0043203787 /DNA_START=62 /DNA_END=2239 /DNA_ORIENTATION=+
MPSISILLVLLGICPQIEGFVLSRGRAQNQLSWGEARAKAATTVAQLERNELKQIIRGSHFAATGSPDVGFYVGNTPAIHRLGIPALKMQDAAQGFRATEPKTDGTTTAWPCMLALASTWDEELVGLVAASIGDEFKGKGANVILGPSINVHRPAAGGRNFEYLSGEDPYLGARLTRAYVRGVQDRGVMAVAKHFAFNEQETNRMNMSAKVGPRTKWELYYPPFKAAVDAGVGAFMCAYNKVNGTYACHNHDILVQDLKTTMGFKGFVMSDWAAMHHVDALSQGMDQEQPGQIMLGSDPVFGVLMDSVVSSLSRSVLDVAATNILTAVYRFGLDVEPSCTPPNCSEELHSDQTSTETLGHPHHEVALTAASSSLVLLKNKDGLLPLTKDKATSLAVLGLAAWDESHKYFVGYGSGYVSPGSSAKTPGAAIMDRAAKAGITVTFPKTENLTEAVDVAAAADVVIVVVGTPASEGVDRARLSLSDYGDELISAVTATKKPTVVLMQTPGAVLTPWRDEVAAIANIFMGGVGTGDAWASFLFGDLAPRGRLPIMMPATETDVIPVSSDEDVDYSEDLFTSYRSPSLKAAFPFGHGLSFTSFEYNKAIASSTDCTTGAVCVTVEVKNSGQRDGEELVQAYMHFPNPSGGDDAWAKQTPDIVLRGFRRTKVLKPGESQHLRFEFTDEDLSLYSPIAGGWVPQTSVEICLGASSGDLRQKLAVDLSSDSTR